MLLNSYSFAFPTLHSFPCSFSLLYLGTSDHVHSGAHGSGAVLQHHKPQLDGCQCPFLDRSLQKATSWQGSVGSPTELGADPSLRQRPPMQACQSSPPLPRIDATSEHQGYFQPAGVKLPFFLCSHHYLPIKGTLFSCQLTPRD